MRRRMLALAVLVASGIAFGCSEDQPNTGPTIHCFNEKTKQWEERKGRFTADVNTGKVTVTCPTGE